MKTETKDADELDVTNWEADLEPVIKQINKIELQVGDFIDGHKIIEISKFKYTPDQIDVFTDKVVIGMCGDGTNKVYVINKAKEETE